MRRTLAGTAAALLAALAIGAPLATGAQAGSSTVQCGAGASSAECRLLDDLAAQLAPVAPLLGTALAPLTGEAQDLAARSDQGGVPTAEVLDVAGSLAGALGSLPGPVQSLVGTTRLAEINDTLDALVGALTAPVASPQQSSSGSAATPAKAQTSSPVSAPVGGSRSMGSSNVDAPAPAGGSTSNDAIPSVPVGDPLALAPLALPDFGFDPSFAPAATTTADVATPSAAAVEVALADAIDGGGRAAEVAVAAILSVLLLGAAGIAQLQANRHQIPD